MDVKKGKYQKVASGNEIKGAHSIFLFFHWVNVGI